MRHLAAWLWAAMLLSGCGGQQPADSSDDTAAAVEPQPVVTTAKQQPSPKAAAEGPRELHANTRLTEVPEALLDAAKLADGWIQLFDGRTLFGWQANSDANWSVRDGVIHADSGPKGLIVTSVPFADYELLCDFRLAEGGNSGIFLRTPVTPENPAVNCYELNICDTHKAFRTGSLVARKKGPEGVTVEGEWHTFHVTLVGTKMSVELDGTSVLEFIDTGDSPLVSGRIGLQMNGGQIEFRNVFVRPLGGKPLFNGRDLSGWRVVPGGKSRFSVADGAIHAEDGAGFLETESTWGDFVLQAEARTNGEELNSGIFFRAVAGTAEHPSDGYELQIHNGIKPSGPLQPSNAGTGAIFRRTTARFVASRDGEWTALTLVASGPRMAVWVNGLQVTDWVDTRPDHLNPRRGRRLDAGHISLQGHDPTTDLDFRAIRAAALP